MQKCALQASNFHLLCIGQRHLFAVATTIAAYLTNNFILCTLVGISVPSDFGFESYHVWCGRSFFSPIQARFGASRNFKLGSFFISYKITDSQEASISMTAKIDLSLEDLLR